MNPSFSWVRTAVSCGVVLGLFFASLTVFANEPKKKSTDVSFDEVLVQGKYHFSDEAVTTVEDDKVLEGLLGARAHFKDRLKKSQVRH